MSDRPTLSLAAGYHLRAKALCDGQVGLKSFELRAIAYKNDGLGHDEFMAGKFDAGEFSLTKNLALGDDTDATYSSFIWNRQVWEDQRAVMGGDPWKFGIRANEKVLNTIVRYAGEQGLLAKPVTLNDLFVAIDEAIRKLTLSRKRLCRNSLGALRRVSGRTDTCLNSRSSNTVRSEVSRPMNGIAKQPPR